MAVKPILFHTDMVRAILGRRKMQTRRIIKPQPRGRLCYIMAGSNHGKWNYPSESASKLWDTDFTLPTDLTEVEASQLWTPPCHTDDILYVRETWRMLEIPDRNGSIYAYKADLIEWYETRDKMTIWRPSIHMPKEAARIFLLVTSVRMEHLQDMSRDDAVAEGVPVEMKDIAPDLGYYRLWDKMQTIWDSSIKPADLECYGWNANPWVWVITFERCENPWRLRMNKQEFRQCEPGATRPTRGTEGAN